MGGNESRIKAVSDTVNEAINETMISNNQQCSQTNSNVQNMEFKNIDASKTGCTPNFSKIAQKSVQIPNMKCISDNTSIQDFNDTFMQKLNEKLSSSTEGALTSNSSYVDSAKNLSNKLANSMKVTNTVECMQRNISSQNFVIKNIKSGCPACCNTGSCGFLFDNSDKLCKINFNKIVQASVQKAMFECSQESKALNKLKKELVNDIKSDMDTKAVGITGTASVMSICVCCTIVMCAVLIFFLIKF